MKILVTADWHIGVTQYGVINDDGRNSRLVDIENTLMKIVDYAHKNNVDLFICAGDVFHTNRPSIEEQRIFFRVLNALKSHGVMSRFIIGNHDHNSKIGSSHALKLFMDMYESDPLIKIYDETTFESFSEPLWRSIICFYPYHATPPDWSQFERGDASSVCLVCHSHLEGAVVGAEPFEIRGDCATKFADLPVDYVFAGHFHKPQLLSTRPLAFYPGSPNAVDFSERNDVKGVVIVDNIGATFKTVGFESRRLIQVDLVDSATISDDQLSLLNGVIVKVNVDLFEKDISKFDESSIRDSLIKAGVHSIAGIHLHVRREEQKRNPEIKLNSDLKDNFIKYLKGRGVGDIEEQLRFRGLEIIDQCASYRSTKA